MRIKIGSLPKPKGPRPVVKRGGVKMKLKPNIKGLGGIKF